MAGGSGERFWPVSTADKPKQFLKLAHPEKTLIEQSLERAKLLGEAFVATNRLFSQITSSVCGLDEAHVFAEPDK
ncbi:sugar phosphate nucleotidyltransferase, partial [Escherichia coli]|uniref:sugar phosphate nucleotidyltransferase n=1 Tax=Escherichia coli TaxID=562 RepID=UPI0039DF8AE3